MADKKNVIVGAARLYIGEFDATFPAFAVADAFGNGIDGTLDGDADWRDIGYTQEGLEVSYEPDFGDVEVDQLLDSARIHKSSVRVMVNTTLAEATLENLMIAWAQRTGSYTHSATPNVTTGITDTLTIEGGSLGQAPVERQLVAVGNAPENATTGNYNERVYHVERAISVESSSHALRRNEATVYPVSFRVLPTDDANAPYGTITDRVVT